MTDIVCLVPAGGMRVVLDRAMGTETADPQPGTLTGSTKGRVLLDGGTFLMGTGDPRSHPADGEVPFTGCASIPS